MLFLLKPVPAPGNRVFCQEKSFSTFPSVKHSKTPGVPNPESLQKFAEQKRGKLEQKEAHHRTGNFSLFSTVRNSGSNSLVLNF